MKIRPLDKTAHVWVKVDTALFKKDSANKLFIIESCLGRKIKKLTLTKSLSNT